MKLNLKTKIAYGLAGVGDSALYNLAGTFLLFFLSTVVGISPAIAGTLAAIGSIWETVCGAVVGYLSDNTYTRFGKRKPYLLIASFPLAVFTGLLFTSIDASESVRIVYYGITILLFWTSFSTFFVPYLAWGAELTQDYDERTVLRGYTYLFNALGMAMGMILPNIIVDFLLNMGRSSAQSWQLMAVFCGGCSALTIFIGAVGIKDRYEKEYAERKAAGTLPEKKRRTGSRIKELALIIWDMLRNYGQILKLRSVRFIVGTSIFYLVAYAIFCADRMYFFTYNMGLSAAGITFIMALMTFASVLFVPVILRVNRYFDKRTMFIFGMGFCAAIMALFGLTGVHSILMLCLFSMAYCVGSICYWQLVPAMIYDVCEVDQLANRKQRAGLVISLQSLSESMANAVGLQILGLILQFAGFNGEAAVQSQTTLVWTHLSFTVIPAFFMVLSIIMVIKYPITKTMYNKVLDALACREKGEEIDLQPFKKLI
ncbi:MFS transporter [Anaerovorax odorimutans]|uniref:MFS transporter n=1 Tax=Anaerovorax odorimutans TaxID=109327 RepID=A0ABT1RM09_9FIRM|nr:MFS transporter [Anaerovorax odorimutans]MCQ4636224.1 MFS transporter [Anaerovorax odorimutans]